MEKDIMILRLRQDGKTFREIGDELGVTASAIHQRFSKMMDEERSERSVTRDNARDLEIQRMDLAMEAIAAAVRNGDLFAIDRWIALSKQRSKLAGLNAPDQHETTLTVTITPQERVEEMRDRLRTSAEHARRRKLEAEERRTAQARLDQERKALPAHAEEGTQVQVLLAQDRETVLAAQVTQVTQEPAQVDLPDYLSGL